MIAALPMYLRPGNRAAHEAFWALVRDHLRDLGIEAPDDLDMTTGEREVWSAPDLVLSHICNLPYRTDFADRLTVIGASDYGLEGCPPGHYRSLFVVREDHPAKAAEDLGGRTMAYSSSDSQSGWGAPVLWMQKRSLGVRPVAGCRSHENALRAVIEGEAEFAAIDAWTFRLLSEDLPEARRVRVVGATDPSPGMTFVTRAGEDPEPYRAAIGHALSNLPDRDGAALGLRGIVVLPQTAYDLPIPPAPDEMLAMTQG